MYDEGQERIESLREKLSALRTELKARRQAARKRTVDAADLNEAITEAEAAGSPFFPEKGEFKLRSILVLLSN